MIQILLVIMTLVAEIPEVHSRRDPCENYGCQNGGSCMAPYDAPYCVCPDGFVGQYCNTVENRDLNSRCALIDCIPNTICRPVAFCNTCKPEAQCLLLTSVEEGIDIECNRQRYLQVLLETSDNTSYSQVKCRGPLATRDCPQGSVCVDDLRGGGICCVGKPDTAEKPGTCPTLQLVNSCSECSRNEDCIPSGIQCVTTPCPSLKCVVKTTVTPTEPPAACNRQCKKGYTCVLREPICKKRNCNRSPVPTCIREVPQLASCPKPGQIYNRDSFMCKGKFLNRRCDSDEDCDQYRNQRCCPDRCNRNVCTIVPRLN